MPDNNKFLDQYYGMQELYQVVLKAKTPMQFGSRYIQKDEPVLYFENVNISLLSQRNNPIMARGGWANLPQVVWEDRSDVTFTLSEGVVSYKWVKDITRIKKGKRGNEK